MTATQTNNGKAILRQVAVMARANRWGPRTSRRIARMAIMCAMTESNLYVYANVHVPESLKLPHDKVGADHASVGLFQQQTPMWGSAKACMDPATSTAKFVSALQRRGYAQWGGPPIAERIQAVQVSAPGQTDNSPRDGLGDGKNYAANRSRSWLFIVAHWNLAKRSAK